MHYRTSKCDDDEIPIFEPSINVAPAFEVVAKLQRFLVDRHTADNGWPLQRIEITWDGPTSQWSVFIPNLAHERASELPMAICRAALKAVGA